MIRSFLKGKPRLSRREFERELKANLSNLYRAARGLTGRRDEAEELTHDVCLKAIEAFDSAELENTAACLAWLHRIMLNSFRDRYRRDRHSPIDRHFDLDNVIDFVPGTGGPAGEYQRELFRRKLDATLQSLNSEVRYATVLHLVKGVAYKDIAAIMDCPIGTVMSRIAKGRRVLRKELADLDMHALDEGPAGEGGIRP